MMVVSRRAGAMMTMIAVLLHVVAAAVMIVMMMTTIVAAVVAMADGLAIRKVIPALPVTETIATVAVRTMMMTIAAVALRVAAREMTMITMTGAVGTATLKAIPKQPGAAGKIVTVVRVLAAAVLRRATTMMVAAALRGAVHRAAAVDAAAATAVGQVIRKVTPKLPVAAGKIGANTPPKKERTELLLRPF